MNQTRFVIVALFTLQLMGQTRIDLQQQTRGSGFLQPPFSQPVRVGTTLPTTCNPGELFFLSSGAAGANLHVCHSANQWASQGSAGLGNISLSVGGSWVGSRSALGLSAGTGVTVLAADTGSSLNLQFDLDSAHVATLAALQEGGSLLCQSTLNGAGNHECGLLPVLSSYQHGMLLHWVPDTASDGGAIFLNVDSLGLKQVKLPDGETDPGPGELKAGGFYQLWYDGGQFRIVSLVNPRQFVTSTQVQDSAFLYCVSANTIGSQYGCTLSPPLAGYVEGMLFHWRPDVGIGPDAPSLEIDGLGAKPLTHSDGVALVASGEIEGGSMYLVWYDGSVFRLLNPRHPEFVTADDWQNGTALRCQSANTLGMAFECAPWPTPSSLAPGAVFHWIPDIVPNGPATLKIGAQGPYSIKRADGSSDPVAADAPAGHLVPVWFDGSQFRIVGASAAPSGGDLRPACSLSTAGTTWYTPGEPGQKDEFAVCVKDEGDVYVWHVLY
jgi:hypothetical protein